jgi:hypothetical protein
MSSPIPLFHDDPWERGRGLRLDIGATPVGVAIVSQPGGSNTVRRYLDDPALIAYHQQPPTPVPTQPLQH